MPRYSPGTGLCERLVPERWGGVTLSAPRLGGWLGHGASADAAGPVSRRSARSEAEGAEGNAALDSSSGGRQPAYLPSPAPGREDGGRSPPPGGVGLSLVLFCGVLPHFRVKFLTFAHLLHDPRGRASAGGPR